MKAERTIYNNRRMLQRLIEAERRDDGDVVLFRVAQAMRLALEWADGTSHTPPAMDAMMIARFIRNEVARELLKGPWRTSVSQ